MCLKFFLAHAKHQRPASYFLSQMIGTDGKIWTKQTIDPGSWSYSSGRDKTQKTFSNTSLIIKPSYHTKNMIKTYFSFSMWQPHFLETHKLYLVVYLMGFLGFWSWKLSSIRNEDSCTSPILNWLFWTQRPLIGLLWRGPERVTLIFKETRWDTSWRAWINWNPIYFLAN